MEAKQYLVLRKSQLQDSDAQIAPTTICMLQYNLLSVARKYTDYELLSDLFRNTKAERIQLTVSEHIWQIIIEVLTALAEILEIDTEVLKEKLMADNEKIEKLVNYKTLLQAG